LRSGEQISTQPEWKSGQPNEQQAEQQGKIPPSKGEDASMFSM
jgi:hypothetical protein